MEYHAYKKIESPLFWIGIINDNAIKITGTSFFNFIEEKRAIEGKGTVECTIDGKSLQPGKYHLIVGVYDESMALAYDRIGRAKTFNIANNSIEKRYRYRGYIEDGLVWIPTQWRQI